MMIVVTGASGFVGKAVANELMRAGIDKVRLVDRFVEPHPVFATVSGDLTQADVLEKALDGASHVLHLAALPGRAAERDPELSRRVNLDLPMTILAAAEGRRLVFASSIAVFGDLPPEPVDDQTPTSPISVYGTHKMMMELAFANVARRRQAEGLVIRLPGIVARPFGAGGFGSAFLSDIFHAARRGERYALPVSMQAASWLLSVSACARLLVDALLGGSTSPQPVNAPALRVELLELTRRLGGDRAGSLFSFVPDPAIERAFAAHPPLSTLRAEALGLRGDANLDELIAAATDDARSTISDGTLTP